MKRMNDWLVAIIGGLAVMVGGCASGGSSKATSTAAKTPSAAEVMFGQVKGLAGTWMMTDEKGAVQVGVVYRVTSAGSAVCEQMFPGSEHEMVNMYHLDGDRLMVTHYCAQGNQPRMATSTVHSPTVIVFTPESVTNLSSPGADYMASLELIMPDADHLTQKWTSMKDGKTSSHAEFAMVRRTW